MSILMHFSSEGVCPKINPMEIAVAVVLGNPQYEDCSQHGICRVDRFDDYIPCDCPHYLPAILRLSDTGMESLVFQRINISQATFEKHFESAGFRVDTMFRFSKEFQEDINWSGDAISIEPGFYPLRKSADKLEILFP